jgi:hypothetical protein
MKSRDLGRGVAVLALAATVMGTGASAAVAKPHKTSAPKLGTYAGDSIAGGNSHTISANVTKKGSKYSAEVELAFPAKCTNSETRITVPSELLYKVTVPIKGTSIAFKGNSRDTLGIIYPLESTVTVNGHFASNGKFTGTATTKAPAEGVESNVACSAPSAKLKLQFALAPMA